MNLASQIGYDGHNIAFIFYENQIRALMAESPCQERRLEILRASCSGQPREIVNLFLAPMRNLSTSDYAQSFFKNDQTEKSRDHGAVTGHGSAVRVRSAVVSSSKLPHNSENAKRGRFNSGKTQKSGRPSPICFVCNDPKLRHYLGECKKFQTLTKENKRRAVIDAGRCFNCLSTDHIAINCPKGSKCKLCGLESKNKHAAALHSVFAQSGSNDLGAANVRRAEVSHSSDTEEKKGMKRLTTMNLLLCGNWLLITVRLCYCELALSEFLILIPISAR